MVDSLTSGLLVSVALNQFINQNFVPQFPGLIYCLIALPAIAGWATSGYLMYQSGINSSNPIANQGLSPQPTGW